MKLAAAVFAALLAVAVVPALAQEQSATPSYPLKKPELQQWSFAGPFGKFDTAQLQRGYQVYKEVCSACHSMKYMFFRNLGQEGGPQTQKQRQDEPVRPIALERMEET